MSKITLAISLYNAERFIEQTLLSALGQTFDNIDFLIINDGSTDHSIEIIGRVAEVHPRGGQLRVIHHTSNRGTGATRNTAIDYADGEFLFFMDQDDLLAPQCIELLYARMCETPVDFVAGSFAWQDKSGNISRRTILPDRLVADRPHAVAHYRYAYHQHIYVQIWNKLYNLSFLRRNNIRCIDHHLNEDPWFTYQVILSAHTCRLISDCTLYYTIHPDSVSQRNQIEGYSDRICQQYFEIQKLKSAYAQRLRAEPFYPGLICDMILMRIYHCYRMFDSRGKLSTDRKKMVQELLCRDFRLPPKMKWNIHFARLTLHYIPFCLPLSTKYTMLHLLVRINFRKWARNKNRI